VEKEKENKRKMERKEEDKKLKKHLKCKRYQCEELSSTSLWLITLISGT
jgi:hypothetical protein